MKLKQLLASFEFDDIFPTIAVMYPNAKRHKKDFENAYDIMLETEMSPSKKIIRYMIIDSPYGNDSYFGAQDANFKCTWDVLLGKEVKRDKDVDLTDEEIAANCLINAIFLGQHPREFEDSYIKLTRG